MAAHRFHRFAHHPLCREYEGEVLRFGRTRLCRGCVLAGLGAALGLGMGSALPVWPLPWLGSLGIAGALLVIGLIAGLGGPADAGPAEGSPEADDLTARHRLPPPRSKLATRLLPCVAGAFGGIQALRMGGPWGWALVAGTLALLGLLVLLYRRRGPQRGPCATCPERFARHRCRGVREILRRERAFQRLAGRLLAGTRPGEPSGTMS
ncbi:MAG TPA: hypothetical protein VJ600_00150 [Holophagaceae bacterium]|nr:hypothetical protein [Holophagaceae bacterium]